MQASDHSILPIRDLVRHEAFQVRTKLDPHTIARYAGILKNGGSFPPITVARIASPEVKPKGRPLAVFDEIDEGALVLVDGYHRVEAHLAVGRNEVPANVVEASKHEALWLAASANLVHGLPLRARDLRRVFQGYVHAHRYKKANGDLKSYREIASDLNGARSYVTFRAWMRKDFPKLFEQMSNEDGKEAAGGLSDSPPDEPERALLADCHAALASLRSAATLFTPSQRGDTIEALKETLLVFERLTFDLPEF
jgi:hypothetical protein